MPPSYSPARTPSLSCRLSQWICGLHGHDLQLRIGSDSLALRCRFCGHSSPGWALPSPAQRDFVTSAEETPSAPGTAQVSAQAQ
jgi:hypothetical protein